MNEWKIQTIHTHTHTHDIGIDLIYKKIIKYNNICAHLQCSICVLFDLTIAMHTIKWYGWLTCSSFECAIRSQNSLALSVALCRCCSYCFSYLFFRLFYYYSSRHCCCCICLFFLLWMIIPVMNVLCVIHCSTMIIPLWCIFMRKKTNKHTQRMIDKEKNICE